MSLITLSIKFDPENVPCWIREIPGRLKTQEMYEEAVGIEPYSLAFVPDHLNSVRSS